MSSSTKAPISDIKYEYHPAVEKFIEVDIFNVVEYLFNTGLLTDIECRKIVLSKDFVQIRAAMYEIMFTKDSKTVTKILEIFRNRLHPFQNPRILERIFSYLNYDDLAQCKRAIPDGEDIVNSLVISNSSYGKFNLEQFLIMNLSTKNETIKLTNSQYRDYKVEVKASVFQRMLAINPVHGETMLKILQIARDVPPSVNNGSIKVSFTAENRLDNLIANALSNNTVLSNIFKFLSFAYIKTCRTVCRTWNSVSEQFFRKLSTIRFDSRFRPVDFLNVSKYLPLPDLHFTSFKFRLDFEAKILKTEKNPREMLSEFFTKFGMNIRCLDVHWFKEMRSCLLHTSNLTELKLKGDGELRNYFLENTEPEIMIPWTSLQSIKLLSLTDAIIHIEKNKEWKRMTPVTIHIEEVTFFVNGSYPAEIILNDYIDFTKVTDLNFVGPVLTRRQIQFFDWARDKFDAERITFATTGFVNTENSKSAVQCLELYHDHRRGEKMLMPIKQLMLQQARIPLNDLPRSLEKLAICRQSNCRDMENINPIYFPHLNYLSYVTKMDDDFEFFSQLDNCPNLTDIEIRNIYSKKIRRLPRNVKKLRLYDHSGKLKFVSGSTDEHFDLDLLILNFIAFRRLSNLKFDKLRPKVLSLQVAGVFDDTAFVSFVKRNKNMEKIYVRFVPPVPSDVFSQSQLSNIVDKESAYYEFSKEHGKAITLEEFCTIRRSLGVKTAMKGFWSGNGERRDRLYRVDPDSDSFCEDGSDSNDSSDE